MSKWKKELLEFAHDLTHIEINTIIKPNITGGKMPHPRHVLITIAKEYNFKLIQLKLGVENNDIKKETKAGGYDSFCAIRRKALKGIKQYTEKGKERGLTQDEESKKFLLIRIKDMSDLIKSIFERLKKSEETDWDNNYTRKELYDKCPRFPLLLKEIVAIRKIWEVGVERIVMQTVFQMDGDVVTRVTPNLIEEKYKGLHKIHKYGLDTSLSFWKELIHVAADFFKHLVK